MSSTLAGRDLISLKHLTPEEIHALLDRAAAVKSGGDSKAHLAGKEIGLLFGVASTRTRISFQVAAHRLGAHAEYYSAADLQLSNHESLQDTARVMSRYLDALVVRMYDMRSYGSGRQALETLAENLDKPLVNALDDKDHPCQVLADLFTMRELFGTELPRRRVVMTWGYSKRQKSPGVAHSMLTAAALLGMRVTVAAPKDFELDEEYVEFALRVAEASGADLSFCDDLEDALPGADVVYLKDWKSLKLSTEEDLRAREELHADWLLDERRFALAGEQAVFMNCLPIIRGQQATAGVIDGARSVIYDEAENRLHLQQALLASLLEES